MYTSAPMPTNFLLYKHHSHYTSSILITISSLSSLSSSSPSSSSRSHIITITITTRLCYSYKRRNIKLSVFRTLFPSGFAEYFTGGRRMVCLAMNNTFWTKQRRGERANACHTTTRERNGAYGAAFKQARMTRVRAYTYGINSSSAQ